MDVSIADTVFRQFGPASDRIVIHAVWPDGTTSGLVARLRTRSWLCKSTHQARGDSLENIIRSA